MSVTDFNNGLITGLALNGVAFVGGGGRDIEITAIESSDIELKVKYGTDTDWTVFAITTDGLGNYLYTLNGDSGAFVELNPTVEGPIYTFTAGGE